MHLAAPFLDIIQCVKRYRAVLSNVLAIIVAKH